MFGITEREIVVIDRPGFGETAHDYPHAQLEQLVTAHIAGEMLEFSDGNGEHRYPAAAVAGIHAQHATDYANASVQLWQENHGIAGRLFIVDPDQPGDAWEIRKSWRTSGKTFREIAVGLIGGTHRLSGVCHPATVPTSDLRHGAMAATYWATNAVVIMPLEDVPTGRDSTETMRALVAGSRANEFIGERDLNAQPRPGDLDSDRTDY